MIERRQETCADEREGGEGLDALLVFFFFGGGTDIHAALEKCSVVFHK